MGIANAACPVECSTSLVQAKREPARSTAIVSTTIAPTAPSVVSVTAPQIDGDDIIRMEPPIVKQDAVVAEKNAAARLL
jgi:hypothetical protein